MNDTSFGGGWMFVLVILIVLFGMGGGLFGGGNAAAAGYATTQDINAAIAAQTSALNQQSLLLSSANNNYETARLIDNQSMSMASQNNTNLLAAINGFNAVNQNLASNFAQVNQNLADLGYRMDKCCCEIKTQMLENRLQDAQTALNQQFTQISNAEQSAYLLNVMGKWVANPSAVALV